MNMLVQVLRVSGTCTVEPCLTLVQEGFKLLANFFMSQINSWEKSWEVVEERKKSPGSRKHCPYNNSAGLPCKSDLNMVLSERTINGK